jgi:hypothetical protein
MTQMSKRLTPPPSKGETEVGSKKNDRRTKGLSLTLAPGGRTAWKSTSYEEQSSEWTEKLRKLILSQYDHHLFRDPILGNGKVVRGTTASRCAGTAGCCERKMQRHSVSQRRGRMDRLRVADGSIDRSIHPSIHPAFVCWYSEIFTCQCARLPFSVKENSSCWVDGFLCARLFFIILPANTKYAKVLRGEHIYLFG